MTLEAASPYDPAPFTANDPLRTAHLSQASVMDDLRPDRHAGLHPNNFGLIRLAAALQVMFFHCLGHFSFSLPGWMERVYWFPRVPMFFVMSGFLVSLSYERHPNLKDFAAKRLLRIFPALWVCFFLSVASVAVIRPDCLTSANPAVFAGWVTAQLSIGQVFNPSFLRDYGVGSLNGSLWTIPIELQFYAVVPIVYAMLGLHRRGSRVLIPLILLGVVINRCYAGWYLNSESLAVKLFGTTFLPHVWYYFVGIVVQQNFQRFRPLFAGKAVWWIAAHVLVCVLLEPLGWHVGGNLIGPLPSLTLMGLTFSLAYTAPTLSNRLLGKNDISYGTYLYHMVIVNVLIELQWPRTATTVLVVFALTIACAVLSWKLVEQPTLAWKRAFQRPAKPAFEIDVAPARNSPLVRERDHHPESTPQELPQRRSEAAPGERPQQPVAA